jgi:HemY protein
MVRVLLIFALLCLAALGLVPLVDQPGLVTLNLPGYRVETSLTVAAIGVIVLAVLIALLWVIIRKLSTKR